MRNNLLLRSSSIFLSTTRRNQKIKKKRKAYLSSNVRKGRGYNASSCKTIRFIVSYAKSNLV